MFLRWLRLGLEGGQQGQRGPGAHRFRSEPSGFSLK